MTDIVFQHEISKRLSLPTDIRLPNELLQKLSSGNETFEPENLTRQRRRSSLVSTFIYVR